MWWLEENSSNRIMSQSVYDLTPGILSKIYVSNDLSY